MPPSVSIVSGTYNRIEHLQRMVDTARRSCGDLSYEIVLVDGGSTDGTIEWAKTQPDIVLIEQGELLGAIKAFNAGCRAAKGDYVAILNDDIEVSGDTIKRAHSYLEANPQVGQVAFRNHVQGKADKNRFSYGRAFGYLYGQCCMTPRWLGDLAGWWGDEGMRTYGGDTRLSLRLWEMGYSTVPVQGCAIIDHVADDELRQTNDGDQRKLHKGQHPDTLRFVQVWKGRVPTGSNLIMTINDPGKLIVAKAARGELRTMRFQGGMLPNQKPRHALIDAFGQYGPTKIVNRRKLVQQKGRDGYQMAVQEEIAAWRPDLVLFQAQRGNAVKPETVELVRKQWPDMYTVNWNGDVHRELTPFHFAIARAVHLQLTISPDLFPQFKAKGIHNIGYWPIGLEREYIVDRSKKLDGPDVVFLGALYGFGLFPEAETRRDAVLRLAKTRGIKFHLEGPGWDKVGLKVAEHREQHGTNAQLMARSKMTLSISQSKDYWGYTSDRLYNICATGCPALVQRFRGMRDHGFIDGETCIGWSNFDEMISKAKYYLEHDEEREAIGAAGKAMTLERHTWDARIPGLLAMIGGL